MDNFLIIDLGTNTVIFSVLSVRNSELIITHEKSITTRIGEDVSKQNCISQEALDRNIKIISKEVSETQKKFKIRSVFAMTTDAIRCASNGDICVKDINSKCNINMETISGQDEARYTSDAVLGLYKDRGLSAICDIGGGSTEVIITDNDMTKSSESFSMGVVRLEEEFAFSKSDVGLASAITKIEATLAPIKTKVDSLILCGGTATTTAAIMLGIKKYDPNKVEAFKMHKEDIKKLQNVLFSSTLEQIKDLLITDKGRADVITAGVVIINTMLNVFEPKNTFVSTYGPRHGYAMEKLKIKKPCKISYRLENI